MNLPSPIQRLYDPIWENQEIELYIKREDLIMFLLFGML